MSGAGISCCAECGGTLEVLACLVGHWIPSASGWTRTLPINVDTDDDKEPDLCRACRIKWVGFGEADVYLVPLPDDHPTGMKIKTVGLRLEEVVKTLRAEANRLEAYRPVVEVIAEMERP